MFLLPQDQYYQVSSLFKSFNHQMITKSVLDGNTIGDIYVDDLNDPKSALMNGINFEVLIAGDPNNKEFNGRIIDVINEQIIPSAQKIGLPTINLYYNTEQWMRVLEQEVANKFKSSKVKKRFYTFSDSYRQPQKPLRDNASLKPIDATLLNDPSLSNLDKVTQWIELSWPSADLFLQKGVGYCVVEENTIASWCLSAFATDHQLEFALMTDGAFRSKGYAKVAASACMKYCINNEKQPLWNCDADNIASISVAESIGFKKTLDYDVLQIKLMSE